MSDASPTGHRTLARELLRLRCLQLDTAPLEEVIAYDRAATAAAEARLHAGAAEVGAAAPQLKAPELTAPQSAAQQSVAVLPPPGPAVAPARLLLGWYLSGRSPFCRAALTALAAEFRRSDGHTDVVALTPEPAGIARRTSSELALPFPVVHDDGSAAEDFGIRYEAPEEFARLLELPAGDQSHGPAGVLLPLPAMFLIDAGRIRARFVHPDSRYRGEPAEFLRA